jgi:acyl-CoA synthetase (NDP forming)
VVARDDAVGVVALATNLVGGRKYADAAASAISDVAKGTSKPVILFGNLESALSAPHAQKLRAEGIPVLVGTAHALNAVRSYCSWSARRGAARSQPLRAEPDPRIVEIIEQAGGPALNARQGASLLRAAGLRMTRNGFANAQSQVRTLAEDIGFPLVMKTANPAILHKTEMGGVKLGIADAAEAMAAYEAISSSCGPDVELQEQVEIHVELILGMTNDPDFGPAITVGIGGIFTELIADVRTFMAPVSPEQALGQLQQLKAYKLLTGYRGKPAVDLQKLCEFIARFSDFCWTYGSRFSEIDLNPIIAGPTETIAVDSLFVRAK